MGIGSLEYFGEELQSKDFLMHH